MATKIYTLCQISTLMIDLCGVQCVGNWEGKMGAPNWLCPIVSIPTWNSEFPRRKVVGAALYLHFPTGKYQKRTASPNGKLELPSGIETIGHKLLGAPIFPSQFPMHRTPH